MRILILIFLISCTRNQSDIGKRVIVHDFECVKSEFGSGLGITMGGKVALTTTKSCMVAKCFRFEIVLGKRYGMSDVMKKEMVLDDFCISEK